MRYLTIFLCAWATTAGAQTVYWQVDNGSNLVLYAKGHAVTRTDFFVKLQDFWGTNYVTPPAPVITGLAVTETNATDATIGYTVDPASTPNVLEITGVGAFTNASETATPSIQATGLSGGTTYTGLVRSYANGQWSTNDTISFATPAVTECVAVTTYGSSSGDLNIFNGAGPTNVATLITVTSTNINTCQLAFYIKKSTGSVPGTLTAEIRANDGGAPGAVLGTSSGVTVSSIATTYDWVTFSFPSAVPIVNGTAYWFGFRTTHVGGATLYLTVRADALSTGSTKVEAGGTWTDLSTRKVRVITYGQQ